MSGISIACHYFKHSLPDRHTFPYAECIASIREAAYWKKVAECEKRGGGGQNVGGGYGHIVGNTPSEEYEATLEHMPNVLLFNTRNSRAVGTVRY